MSRRAPAPRAGRVGIQANRMAAGGLRASERRITRYSPYIGDGGEEPPLVGNWPATYTGRVSDEYGYTAFYAEWDRNIDLSAFTSISTGRFVLTLTSANSSISWFQIDAGEFATGTRVDIPYDPHYYRLAAAYPWESLQASGNRAITASGGAGDVVDVSFIPDRLSPGTRFASGALYMPPEFTASSVMFYLSP